MKNIDKTIKWAMLARKRQANLKTKSNRRKDKYSVKNLVGEQKRQTTNHLQMQMTGLKHLKEDWIKGDLAPRRESGLHVKSYGFVDMNMVNDPKALLQTKDMAKQQYKKGVLRNLFAIDDRVVVIRGPMKGAIRSIKFILHKSHSAILSNLAEVSSCAHSYQ